MKRFAIVAAVLLVAACTAKKEDMADTAAPAMAPAPAAMDSMAMDSAMRADSAKMDTTRR